MKSNLRLLKIVSYLISIILNVETQAQQQQTAIFNCFNKNDLEKIRHHLVEKQVTEALLASCPVKLSSPSIASKEATFQRRSFLRISFPLKNAEIVPAADIDNKSCHDPGSEKRFFAIYNPMSKRTQFYQFDDQKGVVIVKHLLLKSLLKNSPLTLDQIDLGTITTLLEKLNSHTVYHPRIRSKLALKKVQDWLTKYPEFITHGIWPDNLDKVLQSRYLKPAELVLRETGQISYEKGKIYGVRGDESFHSKRFQKRLSALLMENPIPVCGGVVFLKVTYDENIGYTLWVRKEDEKIARPVRNYMKLPKSSMGTSDLEYSDYNLFRLLTIRHPDYGKTQENVNHEIPQILYDFEVPVPHCLIYKQAVPHIRNVDFPISVEGQYLGVSSELERHRDLERSLKEENFSPSSVMIALDEIRQRQVDKDLLQMKIKYQKIYQQFLEDKWQRLGEYYYSMPTKDFEKIKENDINEKMEEMDRLFHFIRGSYFFGTNLQSNISWNFSSTANYGEVTIFAGDFAKRIGLDKSRTSRKPFKGSEVTTPNSVMNNGDFAEISLHDPDILIIGPKNILEKYQDVYSNLIFKEDLLPEMSLKLELELPIQLP